MSDQTVVHALRLVSPLSVRDAKPTGFDNLFTDASGELSVGFWVSDVTTLTVNYTEDEVCVILEGRVRLTAADGTAAEYGPGDSFLIPSGFRGTWETLEPLRKIYVIREKQPAA
ncbi:cupin domain-containing protein [Pseudoxanthobacter sp.]|uniref:cupin domain-containing protein n=1 Tax=Pseudoxanthobacter sp. TaxID=1925742 RepID=UPI002FE32642